MEEKWKWSHFSFIWIDLLKGERRRQQRAVGDLSLPVHRSGEGSHKHTFFISNVFLLLLLSVIDTPTQACTHIQGPSGEGISEVSPPPSVITLDWSQTITQCDLSANYSEKKWREAKNNGREVFAYVSVRVNYRWLGNTSLLSCTCGCKTRSHLDVVLGKVKAQSSFVQLIEAWMVKDLQPTEDQWICTGEVGSQRAHTASPQQFN